MVQMSFEECPYCTNGMVLNEELRIMEPCPYCSDKRKKLADEGLAIDDSGRTMSLPTVLGINNKYLKANFVYDAVVPEGERIWLEEDSLKRQEEVLTEIYLGLAVAELPERSYCIGIGNKGRIDRLAYPLLAKAYISGLSVAKFISCGDYNRLCVNMSDELEEYYTRDFVVMLIPDGASKADIASAKGLMQTRALKGKPTIFITTWVVEACSTLLGYFDDETYFLARGVFVEYRSSNKKSKYINQLTGVDNDVYNENKVESAPKGSNMVTMGDLLGS